MKALASAMSQPEGTARDPHWILRLNHRNRSLLLAGLLLAIGQHLLDMDAPRWTLGLLGVHCLLYPHVLLAIARRRDDPVRTESVYMALDAALLGLWAGALGFPFEVTAALMALVSLHPMLFEGPSGFIRAMAAMWAGALLAWAGVGFASALPVSFATKALLVSCVWAYLVLLTYAAYRRASAATELRRALSASRDSLRRRLAEIEGLQATMQRQHEREMQQLRDRQILETAVAQRDQELKGAVAEAESSERDQRQLMALVAHEVSSPMGTVASAARLIEMHDKEGRHKTELFRIQRSVARLKTFLDNFLSAERLDAGLTALASQRVWLDAVIRKAVRQVQEADPSFVCTMDAPAHLCCVRGDERLLEVLVFNLLDNARKYAGTALPAHAVVSRDGDGTTRFSVRDQGPGIHPEDLSQVTARFFRSERVQGVPGSGVGLSLVERIARLHEGRLDIQSTVGQGACFTLLLPPSRAEVVEEDDVPEWADSVSAEEHAERLHLSQHAVEARNA